MRQRKSPIRLLISFSIICTGLVFVVLGISAYQQKAHAIISPISDMGPTPTSGSLFFFFTKKKDPEKLKTAIETVIGGAWNNYSVFVKDLTSDISVNIDNAVIYDAASINKIPILAALYYEEQAGTIDLSDTITMQAQDIQDYGTGSMRYDPVGSTYSIQTLAKLMMKQSDNTAAYILANHTIGIEKLQNLVSGWGLTQTDIANNTTSNKDMALLLEKMYAGGITNLARTQEMLTYMKNSDFEDRIPLLLPKDASVYHKIGNGPGNIHDVGIVEYKDLRYYIGILTNDITDEEKAKELEGKIAKTVFDFLKK